MAARRVHRGVVRTAAWGAAAVGCLTGLAAAPVAQADPPPGSPEAKFVADVARNMASYVKPDERVMLGQMVCNVRRGGGTNHDAKQAIFVYMYKSWGAMTTWDVDAPIMTHFAVKDLCPEVGDPEPVPNMLEGD